MSRERALVNGFKKINSPPSPKMPIAAPTVAKISTMMRLRRTPTVRPIWRFSTGSTLVVSAAGGRALMSLVVAEMADVMRLICVPTSSVAAVFSRRDESTERGARVASVSVSNATSL
jgi:hypothetical protein